MWRANSQPWRLTGRDATRSGLSCQVCNCRALPAAQWYQLLPVGGTMAVLQSVAGNPGILNTHEQQQQQQTLTKDSKRRALHEFVLRRYCVNEEQIVRCYFVMFNYYTYHNIWLIVKFSNVVWSIVAKYYLDNGGIISESYSRATFSSWSFA